jgi:hypothetical protein
MSVNYVWNTSNRKDSQQYIEQKIDEWINQEDIFNKKILYIELSLNSPLDTDLSGIIKDDTNNIICTFTSNEFLDKLIINYPAKDKK